MSGLNFPVGRLGLLGALAISIIPLAVGLDAMRQLAFVGTTATARHAPPGVEALILVVMTVVFIALARWMLLRAGARARRGGQALRCAAGEPAVLTRMDRLPTPDRALASHGSLGSATPGAAFATAVRLGWAMEANWADPVLFVIYQVAKPIASVLILVLMLRIVSGGAGDPEYRASWSSGSALWAFVMGGMAGIAWSRPGRPRALPDAEVPDDRPEPLLLLLLGRGTARMGTAAGGAVITLAFGILVLGVPFELDRGRLAAAGR